MITRTETMSVRRLLRLAILSVLFGLAAFGIEFVRFEPSFGVGLSIWLFFPLLALALYGEAVGLVSAVVAASLLLVFGQNIFSVFDAIVFVLTVANSALVIFWTKQARFVDAVILSWFFVIPGYALYHQNLMQNDGAALLELMALKLMSQLVPAMMVQWLAIRQFPLAPLFPKEKKYGALQSMNLASVSRSFQLPVLLLILLFAVDFFTTQSLSVRHELRVEKGLLTARMAMQETERFIEAQAWASGDKSVSNTAQRIKDNLVSKSIATGADLEVVIADQPFEFAEMGGPEIVPSMDGPRPPLSSIDWLYQRDWLAQVPLTVRGEDVFVMLRQTISPEVKSDFKPQVWGLLSAFVFMSGLVLAYRFWVSRFGANIKDILKQFTDWGPGQALELSQPLLRGVVAEFDQARDNLQRLINKSNEDHHELSRANNELQRALKELTLLRSFVNVCATCEKVRVTGDEDEQEEWVSLQEYVQRTGNVSLSHGYCPTCYDRTMQELRNS